MKIFIQSATGKTIPVDVEATDSIANLKLKLHEIHGIPPAEQQLFIAQLEDGCISDYNIEPESTLYLVQKEITVTVKMQDALEITLELKPWTKSVESIQAMIESMTLIPRHEQRLMLSRRDGHDVVKVKTDTVVIDVTLSDTVKELKENIQSVVRIRPEQQRLSFDNENLDDDKTLFDYKIQNKSLIKMSLYPPVPMTIFIKHLIGTMFPLEVFVTDTVESVKIRIKAREGVPVRMQRLLFLGKQLEDSRTLDEYNIYKEATLNFAPRLGHYAQPVIVAAGGDFIPSKN